MDKIKKFKKETMIIAVCVIVLTLTTIGVSYATILDVSSNNANRDINIGNLTVNYSDSSSTLNNDYIKVLTDEEGLEGAAQSTVYIQNNSKVNNFYNISVGYDYDSFINEENFVDGDNLIPLEYIKLAVFEFDTVNKELNQVSSVISLSETPLKYTDTTDIYNNMFSVFTDEINRASSGDNAKTLSIKIWLDESIPEEYKSDEIMLKLNISEISSEPTANLNGNLSGVTLSEGTISFLNDSYKTTIDAAGNFTINDIVPGVYPVTIQDITGMKYTTNLFVSSSNTISYEKFITSHTIKENDNIYSIAFTYGVTLSQLKEINNLQISANDVKLSKGKELLIPESYKLNITANSEIPLNLLVEEELRIK